MAVVDTHVKFTDMDVHAPGFDIDVKSVDIRVNCPYESALTRMSRMLTWMSHKTNTHMDVSCVDNHVSHKVKTACTPAQKLLGRLRRVR